MRLAGVRLRSRTAGPGRMSEAFVAWLVSRGFLRGQTDRQACRFRRLILFRNGLALILSIEIPGMPRAHEHLQFADHILQG